MFVSYSLHVSIVGVFFTIRQNGYMVEVRSLKVTARHLNNASCCYEYNVVSVPCIARCYTLLGAARQTHTQCTLSWTARGRQAGKRGRM